MTARIGSMAQRALVCASVAIAATAPVAALGSEPPSAGNSIANARYGYEWKLPMGWAQSESRIDCPGSDAMPLAISTAKGTDASETTATVLVSEIVTMVPGKSPANDPQHLKRMVMTTRRRMEPQGWRFEGQGRKGAFQGRPAVFLDASRRLLGVERTTVTAFYVGTRQFVLYCTSANRPERPRCDDVFAGLSIRELGREDSEAPHPAEQQGLQDAQFHVSYDPPGDGWMRSGPFMGFEGRQVVWRWLKSGRQIEVSAFDVSRFMAYPDADALGRAIADQFRDQGAKVRVEKATLASQPCARVTVDRRKEKDRWDTFILRRPGLVYSVVVIGPSRDEAFIAGALAGFRLTP